MARPIEIPIKLPADTKGAVAATQALAKLEAASARVASAQATQAKAQNQVAVSAQRLATEQARTSRELSNAAAAASRAESAAIRLAKAQKDASRPPSAGLTGYFNSLKGEIAGATLAMTGFGAALGAAMATAQSFAAAFDMKARLDATTQSINLQLNGVRDTGKVWDEAAGYAAKYKLTQQETAAALQASVGILRNSNATVEQTFGVLQRLTVLNPAENIEGAAFAVRELASGDILSLADRFNVSKKAAYEMRDAIVAGADPIAVLSQYLDNAGVSMDTLKVKTEGAMGAQKDLAIAQEEFALAQAEWAAGPGLAILEYQTNATRGLAQVMSGDMAGAQEGMRDRFAEIYGVSNQYNTSIEQGTTGGSQWGEATNEAAAAADQMGDATKMTAEALVEETAKKLQSAKAAQDLAAFQADLAAQAAGVAGGHVTVGAAALILAGKWNIASEEAERLIRLQNQLGGGVGGRGVAGTRGNQRLTYAQQRDAREQRMAGAGPQEAGTVANLYVEQQQAAAQKVLDARKKAELEAERAAKAGGAARVSAEQRADDKIVDLARDTAAKLVEIDQRAAEQRAAAARQLASDIATTTADLVADQEANDLELVGASEEQRAKLAAREQAEANARIAAAKAVEEAKATAAGGDAELAQDQYQIRQEQIAKQQQLDEDYYNRRAELGEGDQAALKEQYDQATKAAADAAQVRMDLAAAEAQQRQEQLAAEKQAVLDDAAARAEAMDSTGKNAMSAKEFVDKLDEALRNLPTQVTTTVTVNEVRTSGGSSESSDSGGGGGSNAKAAGGGSFVTSGPTHFTVGDNPGGRELVSVIPLSGAGRSSVHGPNVHMAGGGVVDVAAEEAERRLRDAPGGPTMPTAGGGQATRRAAQAAAQAEEAAKPAIADYAKAVKENVEVLSDVLRLRMALNDPATWTPIPTAMIESVAGDADQVGRAFAQIASTYDTKVLEGAKLYTDALSGTYQVIKDGVETFDALRIAELLPADKLAAFEASSRAVIDTVGRLGSQAGAIGDVTALSQVAGAMALLPTLGMGGGATTNTTMGGVNINIYAQPGQDVNMIADAVMRRLGQSVGSRRY